MKPIFNPFTGDIDFIADSVSSSEFAEKVQEEFDLEGVGSVGDLIVASDITPDTVKAITTNYIYPKAAFGVITSFVTPTRVKVLITGRLSGAAYQLSGLTFGKILFISSTGKLDTTPPVTGPYQKMGIALKSDTIFLLPNLEIVNRA